MRHDLHHPGHRVRVLARDYERARAQRHVFLELGALWTPHHAGELLREFERRRLHAESFTGSQAEHESEVDMN